MTTQEKVLHIRKITMSPWSNIAAALNKCNGDVDATVKQLIAEKQADATDMANRVAEASIVHGYVHNNKIGAMIVLACQTDFVAKNETFLNLAKDICMHIVSAPIAPGWVSKETLPDDLCEIWKCEFEREHADGKKPPQVVAKIVDGKLAKRLGEMCLVNQKFVKDDTKTIGQLIAEVSATLGEKIEVKKFIKVTTNEQKL